MSTIWNGFQRRKTPAGNRLAIQLTEGSATCYPLYYFIDSVSSDGRQLVYHRAEAGDVQIHALDLTSGASRQLTRAGAPRTRWIPWCVESGRGVLDHRSVLDVKTDTLLYFDGNVLRQVGLDGTNDRALFTLPGDRLPIGQNCMSGDGNWFVYIHHDRKLFDEVYGSPGGRHLSKGTVLAAYNLKTAEHRTLVVINSPIHHVLPYGKDQFIFCHPTMENGMLLTDIHGGWYTHLRTMDEFGGQVCHYIATQRGIMYEVLGREDEVLAGLYNPRSHARYEFALPKEFGYTHTGRDPEGRLWFFENADKTFQNDHHVTHDLRFLVRHDPDGQDDWLNLTGHWPTYGNGQKAHFHPQVMPDRKWILMTAGDPQTETNHLFLIDISDLTDTTGIPAVE